VIKFKIKTEDNLKRRRREMQNKRGQSILEYVIVLTVIVAGIAIAANTVLKKAVQDGVNNTANSITTATGKLPGATTP
jgi:hypothetical protein